MVLFYGGHLTLRGELSRAGLVSFMFYQASLASAMGTLSDIFSSLMAALGAAVEVVRLLRRQPAHPECGSLTLKDLKGHIEFQGVTFSYPTRLGVRRFEFVPLPFSQFCLHVHESTHAHLLAALRQCVWLNRGLEAGGSTARQCRNPTVKGQIDFQWGHLRVPNLIMAMGNALCLTSECVDVNCTLGGLRMIAMKATLRLKTSRPSDPLAMCDYWWLATVARNSSRRGAFVADHDCKFNSILGCPAERRNVCCRAEAHTL